MTWEQSLVSYGVMNIPAFSSGLSVLDITGRKPKTHLGGRKGALPWSTPRKHVMCWGAGAWALGKGGQSSALWPQHPGTGWHGALCWPVSRMVIISCGCRAPGVWLHGHLEAATLATDFLLQGVKWEPREAKSPGPMASVHGARLGPDPTPLGYPIPHPGSQGCPQA